MIAICLGNQYVAVFKDIEPSWIFKSIGKQRDLKAIRCSRLFAFPSDDIGKVFGLAGVGCRKRWVGFLLLSETRSKDQSEERQQCDIFHTTHDSMAGRPKNHAVEKIDADCFLR